MLYHRQVGRLGAPSRQVRSSPASVARHFLMTSGVDEYRSAVLAPAAAGPSAEPSAGPRNPATGLERPARRRVRPAIFRWAAPPYFLVGDLLAYSLTQVWLSPSDGDLVTLAVMLGCFNLSGLYRSRLTLSLLDDLPYLSGGVLAATALANWIAMWRGIPGTSLPRSLLDGALVLLSIAVVRAAAYQIIRVERREGRVCHSALILGAGHVGIRLTEAMQGHPELGLDPVGFIDSSPRVDSHGGLPAPLLGGYAKLAAMIKKFRVEVVVVAFGALRESELIDVLRTCDRLQCEIMFVPRLFEVHNITRDMDQVWGIPLVRVRRAPFRSVSWRVKRLVDAVLAAVAIVVLLPVGVLCALAVSWETGPGFLFRQERVGLDGRPFVLLKFRSLAPASDTEASVRWNISHDDRLGPVGRILRRTSLDELPQLWNVLRGDMSLVGPRPERAHFVQEFSGNIPRYLARHRVPAGLTGWAQVHGLRGDTSIEDRASFDNFYIENWSLWGDAKIMFRTLGQVLRRGGS